MEKAVNVIWAISKQRKVKIAMRKAIGLHPRELAVIKIFYEQQNEIIKKKATVVKSALLASASPMSGRAIASTVYLKWLSFRKPI